MNTYSLLVILGLVLVLIDMVVAVAGRVFAHHVLLSIGVLIIGIAILAGSPIITHT